MKKIHFFLRVFLVLSLLLPFSASAQSTNKSTSPTTPRVEISPAIRSGTFIEGGIFEVPIKIDTKGQSINTIELFIKYDPQKLSIVTPSGGTSIIELWVEPPTYNNEKGTEKLAGIVKNGIVTDSGLIVTLTFKAKSTGEAVVSITDESRVLLNDGMGTDAIIESVRGVYTIQSRPPGGVSVYSPTHPIQDTWYNNNSPVFTWDKDADVNGFSVILDNKPNTVPENKVVTTETTFSYENIPNGISYFHIKSVKKGAWGETTHFRVKIDAETPVQFTPTANFLKKSNVEQALVNFSTTDRLSGIDHYEIGIIDPSMPGQESAVFIQSESPYQIPLTSNKELVVIVRAFDNAGNILDSTITVKAPFALLKLFGNDRSNILAWALSILLLFILIHYLFGHHIIHQIKKGYQLLKNSDLEQ